MRRLSFVLALALATVMALAGTATAASKFRTFGTGEVSFSGGTATLTNDSGEYSGVYLASKSRSGKRIASIHFSFHHSGSVAGGAPRFSIPLDTNRNGGLDGYAFLDALTCGNTGTVSTDAANCAVFLNFSSEWFVNWDAMVAAHPTWRIAPGKVPFVIADQPGTYVLSNIDLR
ncbi:MAG TPA: hypothetical protein VHK05_04145 [Candidatus Limnocylindrales bacterium]|jgi:hypothetical protein|nr:hypothetical protein [Candidatus Limnocylindrales bacterium]